MADRFTDGCTHLIESSNLIDLTIGSITTGVGVAVGVVVVVLLLLFVVVAGVAVGVVVSTDTLLVLLLFAAPGRTGEAMGCPPRNTSYETISTIPECL